MMRAMRASPWLLVLGVLVGCGGRKAPEPAAPAPVAPEGQPTFVTIDLTPDEEDDLDGIEIRKIAAECSNLLDLEPAARLGRLNDEQVRCLLDALDAAERQTLKNKISRVLMADAWAKGDTHRWMGVVARHLEEIERSDPDLVYQYAYHLVQLGNPERMDQAIYWADVALENKATWEGDVHVRRVYALLKVKTMAELRSWEYLEGVYRQSRSDADLAEAEAARAELKTAAREWVDFARQSGKDRTEAMRICAMAAGNSTFCEE